jgi:ubiquinone/menaquinone biosynthesis C-methylase UbiE
MSQPSNEKRYIPALSFHWLTPLYDPLLKWVMLKRAQPEAHITGVDGDPEVLDIARKKSEGVNIQWDEGLASSLPYPDSTFDRVVTSLVIHHLVIDDKREAFKEIFRVLKLRGELYILDFGAPHSSLTRFMTTYMRRLEETADNFDGQIPLFVTEAGFGKVKEAQNFVTIFGPLSLWRAIKGV